MACIRIGCESIERMRIWASVVCTIGKASDEYEMFSASDKRFATSDKKVIYVKKPN